MTIRGMTRDDWNSVLVLDQLKKEKLAPSDALSALEEACHLIVRLSEQLGLLRSRVQWALDNQNKGK